MGDILQLFTQLFESYPSQIITGIIAGLITYSITKHFEKRRLTTLPEKLVQSLGRTIYTAQQGGIYRALDNARNIVRTRNILASQLEDISHLLNSDIDVLAGLLEEQERKNNQAEVYRIINSLADTWPSKKDELAWAFKKRLVAIGVIQANES